MAALRFGAPAPAPAASRDTDARLAAQAAAGNRGAFHELYRLHVDAVYRRLSHLLGPDPEREDLVQQVFCEVYRGLPSFRGESAFTTWLHRVVVNVAYQHLRRHRRKPTEPLEDLALDALIEPSISPEGRAHKKQELQQALQFLSRLKPKKRIAFVLRHVEELSLEEIGALVGARPAAVGQRVRHAQLELEEMLAREKRVQTRRGEL